MADSYDKRAAGWNPFNLQPLQREASQASVILHRQAMGEEAETVVTGGGGKLSQARERTTLQLITPISTSLTSLNNCSVNRSTRGDVLLTGKLYIHAFKSDCFFILCKFIFMFICYLLVWKSAWTAISFNAFHLNFLFMLSSFCSGREIILFYMP